jgi:hypothetical protein
MQRRKFILLSAIGGTATAFTGLQCNSRQPVFYKILDKPGALSYICDSQTIREIGSAYRLQKPEENEARKLESLLLTDSGGRSVSSNSDDQFVQTLINNKIEQDFEKANTVVVKGWILAVTEARQCALFAIHNQ